jgi:xanthine dehydrogenase YagS FAD-binding subunit
VHPFTITRVDDPGSAITAHGADRAVAFIAGGTDLLGLIKDRAALPDHLLDINALPAMAAIDVRSDGSLRVGALARMSDLAAHPAVRQR